MLSNKESGGPKSPIREQYSSLVEGIEQIKAKLRHHFSLLKSTRSADELYDVRLQIGTLKSDQRKLEKDRQRLLNALFDLAEKSELEEQSLEDRLIHARKNEEIEARIRTENSLKNVDAKLKHDCMNSTLREVWTESVYPFFKEIHALDRKDPDFIDKTLYYTGLAIYQNNELKKALLGTLGDDISSNMSLTSWPCDSAPPIELTDVDLMIQKVVNRYANRIKTHTHLVRKLNKR